MSEPLNPYASPVIPTEEAVQFDDLGLVETFSFEQEDQQASVEVISVPVSGWHVLIACLAIATVAGLMLASRFEWIIGDAAVVFGVLFSLLMVVVLGFLLSDHTRRFRRNSLDKLRGHPLLGVRGPWQLIISPDRLIVENSAGSQAFARRRTQIWNTEHQLVIFFGGQPIVIPSREPYTAMWREVRQRLWQLAQQDKRAE